MANVVVYNDPNHFWNEVSPHLKKEEAKNSLCLGLSYFFRSNPSDCVYQSALFQNENLLGSLVVSKYRTNHNFLPSPISDRGIAQKLFEGCGSKTKINMTQGLYRCELVKMPNYDSNLSFRTADANDIEKVGEWIEAFHLEAVRHDPPVIGAELAKAKIDKQMIYVLEKNSDLVSIAAWSRDIETSCSVNMVFTPKPLRKNGYASVVTAKLTQHLLNNGKRETNLYTDMTNPTSNKIYMDVGYEFVCDSIHFGIGS